MSWIAITTSPIQRYDDIQAIEGQPQTIPEGVEEAYAEHIAMAKRVATMLADVIGLPDDPVMVSMSGHANPGHAPLEGSGREFIRVTVAAHPRPDTTEPVND